MFSCEFCKIFKNTFFTEHLWTTASARISGSQEFRIEQPSGSNRVIPPKVLLGKGALEICTKFIAEHPCRSVISAHECSPVNLVHIIRTPFYKKTTGGLLLKQTMSMFIVYLRTIVGLCVF